MINKVLISGSRIKCGMTTVILAVALTMMSCAWAIPAPKPNPALYRNAYWAINLCQCRYCNLTGLHMAGFKPGSQLTKENAIYASNPYIDQRSKEVQSAGWMSCDFTGANLSYANLSHSNFRVSLRGYVTPLAKVDFTGANLSYANLAHAILYGANFNGAKLLNAKLQHANLSMASLVKTDFTGADLQHAVSIVDAMHGWGANFRGANFARAKLMDAKLYGDFTGANFSHANLTKALLNSSPEAVPSALDSDDTVKGSWQRVNFSYANLTGTIIKSNSRVIKLQNTSAILCHTTMPDGKINNRDCHART